jgi:hypothetical protein
MGKSTGVAFTFQNSGVLNSGYCRVPGKNFPGKIHRDLPEWQPFVCKLLNTKKMFRGNIRGDNVTPAI